MAAFPFRMPRSGRVRPVRLAAAVMVLLALAAGVLFSAGSDHHRLGHLTAAGHRVTVADLTCAPHTHTDGTGHPDWTGESPVHGHEHGNEWTPNLTPRVRPGGHSTLVSDSAAPLGACRSMSTAHIPVAFRGAKLSLLGVLRV